MIYLDDGAVSCRASWLSAVDQREAQEDMARGKHTSRLQNLTGALRSIGEGQCDDFVVSREFDLRQLLDTPIAVKRSGG